MISLTDQYAGVSDMPQMHRLSNYATTIAARNGNTCITYHSTVIVEFDHENIILRSGGWETVTTKRKMNQASSQFGLGYRVYQAKGLWRVVLPDGSDRAFEDGMQFARRDIL